MSTLALTVPLMVAATTPAPRVEMQIPFSGFYDSRWSDGVIDTLSDVLCQYVDNNDDDSYEYSSPRIQEAVNEVWKLHEPDLNGIYLQVAESYVDYFFGHLNGELNVNFDAKFETVDSPAFYNFSTDQIFVSIAETDRDRMWADLMADSTGVWQTVVDKNLTRSDGFNPLYSTDHTMWSAEDWEQGALQGLVLEAWMALQNVDVQEFEVEVYEEFSCDCVFSDVTWKTAETMVAALTLDQRASIGVSL